MNKNIIVTLIKTVFLAHVLSFVALDFTKLKSMDLEPHNQEAQQLCNFCNALLSDRNIQEAVNAARLTCNHQLHPQCLEDILLKGDLACPTCQSAIEITAEMLAQAGLTQEELLTKLRGLHEDHEVLALASQRLFSASGLPSFYCTFERPGRPLRLVSFQNRIPQNPVHRQNLPQMFPIQNENVIFFILIFAVIFSTFRSAYLA
ncbi:hypothetical protein JST56_01165 [Candidatus Dependentiae bacterium]|jgi:hypothetical protein|nr:hypothetical protein [Candidatus Dependentiae bacterium]